MIRKSWGSVRTFFAAWRIRLFEGYPPQKKFEPARVKKVLVIRLDKVGDLILSTPVFENLKHNLPGVKISVLVRKYNAGVLKGNPFVDEILVYENREERKRARTKGFDLALNLIYDFNLESALACYYSGAVWRAGYKDRHTRNFYNFEAVRDPAPKYELQRNLDILRQLGFKINSENSRLFPSLEEVKECEEFKKALGLDNKELLICLNPGTGRKRREWPLDKFIELGKKLVSEKNAKILVIWGDADKGIAKGLVDGIGKGAYMAPRTNITLLAALLQICRVFVSGNTGPAHVAMAMKVPLVGLYGKGDQLNWIPAGEKSLEVVMAERCSLITVFEVMQGIGKFL